MKCFCNGQASSFITVTGLIVWDQYVAGSLKDFPREKRGKGERWKVQAQTKLPTNFSIFLRDVTNKTNCSNF